MVANPIGDMIVRLKNGSDSRLSSVIVPYSQFREQVLHLLKKHGYVMSFEKREKEGITRTMKVDLMYVNDTPKIANVKQLSKPSKRIYRAVSDLRPVRNGFGVLILSTPKGIMTGLEARKAKVGGEALCEIW